MTPEVPCPNCGKKNPYTASKCAHCETRIAIAGRRNEDGAWWLGCLIPVAAIGFLLYSCSSNNSSESDELSSGSNEAAIRVVVQNDIKQRLRDPNSAEFSDIRPIVVNGANVGVCGRVNSKNGFGGMSGPTRFIGGGNVNAIEGDGTMNAANFDAAWAQMCK